MQPGRLFAFSPDTTAIYDGPSRRFVLVGPDGKAGDAVRFDLATGAGGRRGGVPRANDAHGRIFTEGSPYAVGELRAADSTAITRFARGAAKGDTLAYVRLDKETIEVRSLPAAGQAFRTACVRSPRATTGSRFLMAVSPSFASRITTSTGIRR
jgi:hypothetical protein